MKFLWLFINLFMLASLAQAGPAKSKSDLVDVAYSGDTDQAAVLLKNKKTLVNKKDKSGNTALFYAVGNSDSAMVALLLKNKADLDIKYGKTEDSILFEATRLGSLDVMLNLLKAKPSLLSEKNKEDETVLFAAARAGQSKAAELLLGMGAQANVTNKAGKTPLDIAKEFKWPATVKVLEKKK